MKAEFSYEGVLQSNRNLPSCINENKLASEAFSRHIRNYKEMKNFPPVKKMRKSKIPTYSLKLFDGSFGVFFVLKNLVAFSYTETSSDKYNLDVKLLIALSYFDNDGTNLINPFHKVTYVSGFLFDPDTMNNHLTSQFKKASVKANSLMTKIFKIAKNFPINSKEDVYLLKKKIDSVLKQE